MANPYVNKVQKADGTTILDISDSTALASDVAQGKYFYLATGEKVQGTNSGGGGSVTQDQDGYIVLPPTGGSTPSGLEYETGTWTPSANMESYFISFTNTHTVAPSYYTIEDATGTFSNQYANIHLVNYVNFQQITGEPIDVDGGTTFRYGLVNTQVRNGTNTLAVQNTQITVPYTDSTDSTSSCSRFWAKETGILAYRGSGYYFRSDRTYKWIAVWAPTT